MRPEQFKQRIERILKPFQTDELRDFVSGITDTADVGAIDDGAGYGDPQQDTTPDFVQKDNDGWVSLVTLRR